MAALAVICELKIGRDRVDVEMRWIGDDIHTNGDDHLINRPI
jgi:hypothetical protein